MNTEPVSHVTIRITTVDTNYSLNKVGVGAGNLIPYFVSRGGEEGWEGVREGRNGVEGRNGRKGNGEWCGDTTKKTV